MIPCAPGFGIQLDGGVICSFTDIVIQLSLFRENSYLTNRYVLQCGHQNPDLSTGSCPEEKHSGAISSTDLFSALLHPVHCTVTCCDAKSGYLHMIN